MRLYHHIGGEILERQDREGWGTKVIDRLSTDLREAFPEMKGFSSSNLKYMRYFAQLCPEGRIGQQPADQLPWFHIVTLLTRVSGEAEREWYAAQVVERGDLLFYHTRLKCYIVVELKVVASKPGHAGQLNFSLSVDAQIKLPDDKPTTGLLLSKKKNRLVAEYALSSVNKLNLGTWI